MIAVGLAGIVRNVQTAPRLIDFSHYYLASNFVISGRDPYSEPLRPHCERLGLEYDARIPIGAHPPLLLRTFATFSWLPLAQAYGIWACVQALCAVATVALTLRLLAIPLASRLGVLLIGLVLGSTAMLDHWYYSQVQLLVGVVLLSAYALARREQHQLACALVGLAAFFKLYPAFLLPWFVMYRSIGVRDIVGRLLVIAGVGAAVWGVTGFDAWYGFATRGMPVIRSGSESLSNFSLQAVVARSAEACLDGSAAWLPGLLAKMISLCVIAWAYWTAWRRPLAKHVPFCLLVTVMLLTSPVSWAHYLVLMIFPAAVLIRESLRSSNLYARFGGIAIAVLCLMPYLDLYLLPPAPNWWRVTAHLYPTFVLVFAAALLGGLRTGLSRELAPPTRFPATSWTT